MYRYLTMKTSFKSMKEGVNDVIRSPSLIQAAGIASKVQGEHRS